MSAGTSRPIRPPARLNAGDLKLARSPRRRQGRRLIASSHTTPLFLPSPTPPSTPAPSQTPSDWSPARTSSKRSRATWDTVNVSPSAPTLNNHHDGSPNSKKAKKNEPHTDLATSGIHAAFQIMDIDDVADPRDGTLNKTYPCADIDAFFKAFPGVPVISQSNKSESKQFMSCILCSEGRGCIRREGILVDEHSTLRRHVEAFHLRPYRKWCEQMKFKSMLPNDTKQRREAASDKSKNIVQPTIANHFETKNAVEKPNAYSDKAFAHAAIEWLIDADLPLQAFNTPSFKRMVDLASRANQGIKLPSPGQTCGRVIKMFKQQMCLLQERLNSPTVSGEISLTCDAWQADNTDGYLAVTGHWIEECAVGEWTEEHALFGFTRLNTVHNGTKLGQALYKVCNRLGVVHRVGHITCDNTKNNMAMIQEFARCYNLKTGSTFDSERRHIRCLAHIIDLAAQAVISTRSKSKFYFGDPEDDNLPEHLDAAERDEIDIIRAVSAKVRSSAQRKELFKYVQERCGVQPCQLLLDTKFRWSSTYVMLIRAESRRQAVDEFVCELRLEEKNAEKRRKLATVALEEEEWIRVRLFCNILQHVDNAQHAFMTASRPKFYNALPALEKLYVEWDKALEKPRYQPFVPAITAGIEKLDEYYKDSAAWDTLIMTVVLNPSSKMRLFKKQWVPDLLSQAKDLIQTRFLQRYNDLREHAATISTRIGKSPSPNKPGRLNIDDTDSESDEDSETIDPDRPWLKEWTAYLDSNEVIPDGVGMVQWWGIYGQRYPTWRSLARDYLAIMASPVSSESAFPAAGTTISKRRSRLEGDIVEALECLKSFLHQDILFHDIISAAQEEDYLDLADQVPANKEADSGEVVRDGEEWCWDELVEGLEPEDGEETCISVLPSSQ